MADEELELDVNQSKGGKTTTIIIVVLILLVLILGGVAAWLLLSKGDEGAGDKSGGSDKTAQEAKLPLQYLTILPEFVVNFGPNQRVRYLQIDLQVSSRDAEALKKIGSLMPILRNDVLVVISSQTYEDLKTREGKEKLQKKILNTFNHVLTTAGKAKASESPKVDPADPDAEVKGPIEDVYYLSFIMQ